MDFIAYLEMLSNDSPNPCYFADMESHELLFVNKAMAKILKDYDLGSRRKCYQVVHDIQEPCSFCPNQQLKPLHFHQRTVFNGATQGYFRCNSTKMDLDGRMVNMSKYFSTSGTEQGSQGHLTFEDAMSRCALVLSNFQPEEMLGEFLALIGAFYGAQKAYVFHLNETGVKDSHYWLENNSIKTMKQLASPQVLDALVGWIYQNPEKAVLQLDNVKNHYNPNSLERLIYQFYPMENMLLVPLYQQDHTLSGFVGVTNRRNGNEDYRLLTAVTRFVEESFSVHTITQELKKFNEIDQLTGCYNRKRYGLYLRELQENPPEKLGILFVNLNGLRRTNEFFGYEVGDVQILKALSQLKQYFSQDFYRISGDEFIAFCPDVEETPFHSQVEQLQNQLHDNNNNSFSVGSAWYEGSYDIMNLVATADTVMYINKQEYYCNHLQENPEMTESILMQQPILLEQQL